MVWFSRTAALAARANMRTFCAYLCALAARARQKRNQAASSLACRYLIGNVVFWATVAQQTPTWLSVAWIDIWRKSARITRSWRFLRRHRSEHSAGLMAHRRAVSTCAAAVAGIRQTSENMRGGGIKITLAPGNSMAKTIKKQYQVAGWWRGGE